MPDNNPETLQNIENLIRGHIDDIQDLKVERKKAKEMLDDIFLNDPTFQEHDKVAKEAAKVKSGTKLQILRQPQAAELSKKVKEFTSEIKEGEGALSDYLQEYSKITGATEIEVDGRMLKISKTYQLRLF